MSLEIRRIKEDRRMGVQKSSIQYEIRISPRDLDA